MLCIFTVVCAGVVCCRRSVFWVLDVLLVCLLVFCIDVVCIGVEYHGGVC